MDRATLIGIARGARRGDRESLERFKDAARAAGYTGKRGGWIYAPDGHTVVCQGWQRFAAHVETSRSWADRVLDVPPSVVKVPASPAEAARRAARTTEPGALAGNLATLAKLQRDGFSTDAESGALLDEATSPATDRDRAAVIRERDIVTITPTAGRRFEVLRVDELDGLIQVYPMDLASDVDGWPRWVSPMYARVHGQTSEGNAYARRLMASHAAFRVCRTGGLPGNHLAPLRVPGSEGGGIGRLVCGLLAGGPLAPLDLALVDCLACLDAYAEAMMPEPLANGRAGTPAETRT